MHIAGETLLPAHHAKPVQLLVRRVRPDKPLAPTLLTSVTAAPAGAPVFVGDGQHHPGRRGQKIPRLLRIIHKGVGPGDFVVGRAALKRRGEVLDRVFCAGLGMECQEKLVRSSPGKRQFRLQGEGSLQTQGQPAGVTFGRFEGKLVPRGRHLPPDMARPFVCDLEGSVERRVGRNPQDLVFERWRGEPAVGRESEQRKQDDQSGRIPPPLKAAKG